MNIKIPRLKVKIIRQEQQYRIVAEDVVAKYYKTSFYISFLGWWKLYELIKPYITN